ncbi:hypothetical protein ACLOJK_026826 [Asimina triloba]
MLGLLRVVSVAAGGDELSGSLAALTSWSTTKLPKEAADELLSNLDGAMGSASGQLVVGEEGFVDHGGC